MVNEGFVMISGELIDFFFFFLRSADPLVLKNKGSSPGV